MAEPTPVASSRPWWAAPLTSAITTLFGLALIVISVVLVRPALGDDESWIWIALLFGGAGLAGVGGSLVGRGQPLPPDQRGSVRVVLLVVALVGVAVALAASLAGCGAVQVRAEREITWQRRPGPTCYVRTLADGEVATETTAPTSCVPPPSFCEPGPGEPGYVAPERSF